MKGIIILVGIFGLFSLPSCTDDELFEDLNYSYYDSQYSGPNPFEITGTEYYVDYVTNSSNEIIDTLNLTKVFVHFDRSVLHDPNSRYHVRLEVGSEGSNLTGNEDFTFHRTVELGVHDYCGQVIFLDAVYQPVHSYDMCYTVEY